MLEEEVKCLKELSSDITPQGILQVYFFTSDAAAMQNLAVMELVGQNLDDVLDSRQGTFSVQTTVFIAEQCLQRLEYVHSKGIIHRDIKPENFAVGVGTKCSQIYLLDFGLCQKYYDERCHCPMQTGVSLVGNARYASLNAHKGLQSSRRDDLEALGHMLFQFLLGTLPWTGLAARTTLEKYQKIHAKKEATPAAELCKGFPEQFGTYLTACRQMDFAERPNYRALRKLLTDIQHENQLDRCFDFQIVPDMPSELETPITDLDFEQPDDIICPVNDIMVPDEELSSLINATNSLDRKQGMSRMSTMSGSSSSDGY